MPLGKFKIDELAGMMEHYTGADIEAVCREAALISMREGKKTVSKKHFEEAVEREETAQSRFALGNFLETLEKFDDAEREYRRALELGVSVDAANNLAMLLQRRGALDEAEAYYLKALEVNEDDVDVLFNWATLKLNERGDLDATRILIEKIVTIQPELKKHPLVKALRGEDDDDDDDDEPFVPPI